MHPSIKTALISATVALAFVATAVPVQAANLTTDQINSVLNLLQSFNVETKTIDTVRAVLNGQTPPRNDDQNENERKNGAGMAPGQIGKMMCISLARDLGIGSKGDDVRKLQDMLREAKEAGFSASSTGFYGPMTAEAMKRFQKINGVTSLPTGTVGPMTRGFFERACGKGLTNAGQNSTASKSILAGPITAVGASTVTINHTPVTITSSTVIQVFTGTSTPPTSGTSADLVVGKSAMIEVVRNSTGNLDAVSIKVGIPAIPRE